MTRSCDAFGLKRQSRLAAFVALLLGFSAAAHTVVWVDDGGTYELAAANEGQNVYGAAKTYSQVIFRGDGTLKMTGSDGEAIVRTTLVATNHTLTVDVSDFKFTSPTYRHLRLAGGIDCGTTGKLIVIGATKVTIGDSRSSAGALNSPVYLPNVELPEGAKLTFSRISAWILPNRTEVPWTLDDSVEQALYGECVLNDLKDPETGSLAWANVITLCKGSPVGTGTLDLGGNRLSIYPAYHPTMLPKDTQLADPVVDYLNRYGSDMTCASNLKAKRIACQVRGATFTGSLECDIMDMSSTGTGKKKGTYVFNGPVEAREALNVSTSTSVGQVFTFNGVCFTSGTTEVRCHAAATNATIRIVKKEGETYTPTFRTVTFANETTVYDWHAALELDGGIEVRLNRIDRGTGIVRGNGTVRLGRIDEGAKLLVEPGVTVVKDQAVSGTYGIRTDSVRIGDRDYVTYFGVAGEALDLSTYAGESPVRVPDGAVVYGSTNGAPATVELTAGQTVTLSAAGATWKDNSRITVWYDFSRLGDPNVHRQVVATKDPPTTDGDSTKNPKLLPDDQLGPKSIQVRVNGTTTSCPLIERMYDCRGGDWAGDDWTLYNDRMYSQVKNTGSNEFWASVYTYAITNDTTAPHPYLSAGAETGNTARRLLFPSAYSKPKSITLVFGSQNGGGAGLLADTCTLTVGEVSNIKKAFGREKGLDSSILSNETCDVWLNGVKVDPTKAKFSGGWDVITLQPKFPNSTQLLGLGYSMAYTGGTSDGGGQNYGEIILFNAVPADHERVELERHLAKKWGIAYAGGQTATVDLAGEGAATVDGELALTGTATNVTVSGSGELTVETRAAIPKFAADFEGSIRLGADVCTVAIDDPADPEASAIDVRPATVVLPPSPKFTVTCPNGLPEKGTYELLKAAGGVDSMSWTFELPPRLKAVALPTAMSVKVSAGLMLFLK